jgi:hypothetical protein
MKPTASNFVRRIKRFFGVDVVTTLQNVEERTIAITKTVDGYVMPVRNTIFKRYPVFFTLLVTFGISATFLGIEQVLLQYELLREQPVLILLAGVAVLVFTGRLYKTLG